MKRPEGTKVMVLSPLVRGQKGTHKEVLEAMTRQGFARCRVDGTVHEIKAVPSLDKNVTAMVKQAAINRFSNNDETIAAFAAKRIDVAVQFHPALVVQQTRLRLGKVILPEPVEPVATSVGLRKEENPAFRDWLDEQLKTLYADGVPDQLFAGYLKSKNVDASKIPGLIKEAWH